MAERKRVLPATVDLSPGAAQKRDYGDGTRNHIKPASNPDRFGYKLIVKKEFASEQEGLDVARDLNAKATIQGECGYWTKKEADAKRAEKPGALLFTVWTKKGLDEMKGILDEYLSDNLDKMAPSAGDWKITAREFNIHKPNSESITTSGTSVEWIATQLEMIASAGYITDHRVICSTKNHTGYEFRGLDAEQQDWLEKQLTVFGNKVGMEVKSMSGCLLPSTSQQACCPSDHCTPLPSLMAGRERARKTREGKKEEQELQQMRQLLYRAAVCTYHFRKMGATDEQVAFEMQQCVTDSSYCGEWYNFLSN